MKYYAGIGARVTPPEVLALMTEAARRLETLGYTLRSGGAEGADQAFEAGTAHLKEIFTWKDSTPEAETIAAAIHPCWPACNDNARKQHGRNVMQVLGKNLDAPVEFVVCWTADAKPIGGTRTAIILAKTRKIQIINLADPLQLIELRKRLE